MERKQKDDSVNFTEENILTSLEKKLPDDVVVFYKLHSMVTKSFQFKGNKVRPFPDAYDIYDFMSAVDGLITDYSSIMYDFASQNKRLFYLIMIMMNIYLREACMKILMITRFISQIK